MVSTPFAFGIRTALHRCAAPGSALVATQRNNRDSGMQLSGHLRFNKTDRAGGRLDADQFQAGLFEHRPKLAGGARHQSHAFWKCLKARSPPRVSILVDLPWLTNARVITPLVRAGMFLQLLCRAPSRQPHGSRNLAKPESAARMFGHTARNPQWASKSNLIRPRSTKSRANRINDISPLLTRPAIQSIWFVSP